MGLLNSLVKSVERFQPELLPIGYEQRHIKWVFDIDVATGNVQRNDAGYKKSDMTRPAPKAPGDRTSRNASPTLLVDDASYILGVPNPEKKDSNASEKEHNEFLRLHRIASRYTRRTDLRKALDILENLPSKQRAGIEPKDATALRLDANTWLFDLPDFQRFWSRYLEKRLGAGKSTCALCGELKPALRILPFRVRLFGQNVPIVSINTKEQPAFGSQGKDQLANATACYSCLAKANQVLQHLLLLEKDGDTDKSKSSGRHAVVLARDDSRGKGKQPLRNQIAVFWTKEQREVQLKEGEKREFEYLAKAPIEEFDEIPEDAAPAKVGQCRALLEAPFVGSKDTAELPANRFYLAVLSPNKSRLVVREWMEEKIDKTRDNIKHYMDALQIGHPDGRGVWWPPLPSILEALCSYTSAKKPNGEKPRLRVGPDITSKLVRCIYTGTPPPDALLTRAVGCFRVPDPPTDDTPQGREQRKRQMLRRMAVAAAMKLVLTYDKDRKEQKAMEQLKTVQDAISDYKQQAPYNCGVLLAILEAIQRRASSSGRGVNTTLVDRFYGAASTAPATVFANLINMATKAHLPKLRREGKEFFRVRSQTDAVNINELMEKVCDAINAAGGFPPPLTPEQQAAFALGFYHQRAELNPPKRQSKSSSTMKPNTIGGQQ